jgi:hypothetical protein
MHTQAWSWHAPRVTPRCLAVYVYSQVHPTGPYTRIVCIYSRTHAQELLVVGGQSVHVPLLLVACFREWETGGSHSGPVHADAEAATSQPEEPAQGKCTCVGAPCGPRGPGSGHALYSSYSCCLSLQLAVGGACYLLLLPTEEHVREPFSSLGRVPCHAAASRLLWCAS